MARFLILILFMVIVVRPADWIPVGKFTDNNIISIAFPDPGFGIVATNRELFVSRDTGFTWDRRFVLPDSAAWIIQSFFLDTIRWWLRAGNRQELLFTADGGESWHSGSFPDSFGVRDCFFSDSLRGWACGVAGASIYRSPGIILKTTDRGKSWSTAFRYPGDWAAFMAIRFINNSTGFVVGNESPGREGLSPESIIYGTSDTGRTWTVVYRGDPTTFEFATPTLTSLQFLNDSIGWAVGSYSFRHDLNLEVPTIVSTLDGGASWKASLLFPMSMREPPEYDKCGNFSFYDASHGCLIAKTFQDHTPVLLSTSDGGATWQKHLESSSGLSVVLMHDSTHGWAGGNDGNFHILTSHKTEIRSHRAHKTSPSASFRAEVVKGCYLLNGRCFTGKTFHGIMIKSTSGRKNHSDKFRLSKSGIGR